MNAEWHGGRDKSRTHPGCFQPGKRAVPEEADKNQLRVKINSRPLFTAVRSRVVSPSATPGASILMNKTVAMMGLGALAALRPAPALGKRRTKVQPIFFPAAEGRLGRRRFFVTAYSDARLRTADTLAEERAALGAGPGEARA